MNTLKDDTMDENIISSEEARLLLETSLGKRDFEVDEIEAKHIFDKKKIATINLAFRVHKRLDGEIWTCKKKTSFSLGAQQQQQKQHAQQMVQMHIDQVAQEIVEDYMEFARDVVDVAGTRIEISYRDGAWAECQRCDERVTLEALQNQISPVSMGEEVPYQPMTYSSDIERFIRDLDEDKRKTLKYYLLGGLRKKCRCDFGEPKDLYR